MRSGNRLAWALAVSVGLKIAIVALHLWPRHWAVAVLLFTTPDLWIFTGVLIPNAGWIWPLVRDFATTEKEVWLTIDDGPEPGTTLPMLDLLDAHEARATFFLIGRKARAHPALVAEILRRGHTVGNHTDTHPLFTFWFAGPRRTAREFDRCQDTLEQATGHHVSLFRTPAGIRSFFLHSVLAQRASTLIGWRARGREQFAATPELPLRRLVRGIDPGAILLLHESNEHATRRIALLSQLLDHLSRHGYRCVVPNPSQLSSGAAHFAASTTSGST